MRPWVLRRCQLEAAAKMARPFGLGNAKRLSAMHVIPDRSAPDNLPIGEMVCEPEI
jgi:hypothetical protein